MVLLQDKVGVKIFQGLNACALAECCIYARGMFQEKFKMVWFAFF